MSSFICIVSGHRDIAVVMSWLNMLLRARRVGISVEQIHYMYTKTSDPLPRVTGPRHTTVQNHEVPDAHKQHI